MPAKKSQQRPTKPSLGNDPDDAVICALVGRPGATAAEVADVAGIGRSTAAKALAAHEAAGRVTRAPGGREGGRRAADRWTFRVSDDAAKKTSRAQRPKASARPSAPGEHRLGRGELASMVLDHVRAHPGEHSASSVATALGGKSSGAVANALTRFVLSGEVLQVSDAPRRYRARED